MRYLIVIAALLMVVGCAGRASSVSPVAVSTLEFKHLACEDTKALLSQKTAEQNALTRKQNNAATADAVGVFLILLPLGSVFGADVEGELAQVKGEVNALRRAIGMNCVIK